MSDTDPPATGVYDRPGSIVGRILGLLPAPLRVWLLRHREVSKFLIVGGTCFVFTVVVNYALKLTVLAPKPVTALAVATVLATVLSYVLNREWSFRTRGGRERHHEAALFFAISAVAVIINAAPMWFARYVLDLRVPDVSRLVQEVSDFLSGIVLGTLLAMVFRLAALRRWVFPQADVRPRRPLGRRPADRHAAAAAPPAPGSAVRAEAVTPPRVDEVPRTGDPRRAA